MGAPKRKRVRLTDRDPNGRDSPNTPCVAERGRGGAENERLDERASRPTLANGYPQGCFNGDRAGETSDDSNVWKQNCGIVDLIF